MAYEKQNWECGQVITADKLNHMEDGIAAGGDCDCDAGYACYHGGDTIFNETVTLGALRPGVYLALIPYNKVIHATEILVSINGGEFVEVSSNENEAFGDQELVDPPFFIAPDEVSDYSNTAFITSLSDVHTVEVKAAGGEDDITGATTYCFDQAVDARIPCFGVETFSQSGSATVNPGDTEIIPVYNSDATDGIFSYAAISGFNLRSSQLKCYGIIPVFNDNAPYGIARFDVMVANNTENPINVSGIRVMALCNRPCGSSNR